MKRLFMLLVALVLSGCRLPTNGVDMSACQQLSVTAGEFDKVLLFNCSLEEVWVFAVERQSSNVIDPMPWYDLDGTIPHPKWVPGEERAADNIMGYTYGDDIRLFIYIRGWVIVDGADVEKIALSQLKDAAHAELLEAGGLITLNFNSGSE